MAAPSSEKVLLGAAALLVVASAAVFGTMAWRHRAPTGTVPAVELASTPYAATAPDAPPVKTETWTAPGAQTRGRDWIYDTFTPPEIFYNARTKQFTVKPPSSLLDEDQEPFGLDLVAVRPEPFRLQLIGYVGADGQGRGMFQNVPSGEMIMGQAGQRVPKLGLTIKSFDVRPQPVKIGESAPTNQRVATAVVRDEKAGRDITLTDRGRVFTGTVFAFVAASGENAAREVRAGDTFKLEDATYHIDRISITPPLIEVTKEAPSLPQPDRRELRPRENEEPDRPEGGGL